MKPMWRAKFKFVCVIVTCSKSLEGEILATFQLYTALSRINLRGPMAVPMFPIVSRAIRFHWSSTARTCCKREGSRGVQAPMMSRPTNTHEGSALQSLLQSAHRSDPQPRSRNKNTRRTFIRWDHIHHLKVCCHAVGVSCDIFRKAARRMLYLFTERDRTYDAG